jgi:hypothetical protein
MVYTGTGNRSGHGDWPIRAMVGTQPKYYTAQ